MQIQSVFVSRSSQCMHMITGGTGKPTSGLLQGVSAVMSFGLSVLCATYSGNLIASLTGKLPFHLSIMNVHSQITFVFYELKCHLEKAR